jgi:hypothetical protein
MNWLKVGLQLVPNLELRTVFFRDKNSACWEPFWYYHLKRVPILTRSLHFIDGVLHVEAEFDYFVRGGKFTFHSLLTRKGKRRFFAAVKTQMDRFCFKLLSHVDQNRTSHTFTSKNSLLLVFYLKLNASMFEDSSCFWIIIRLRRFHHI